MIAWNKCVEVPHWHTTLILWIFRSVFATKITAAFIFIVVLIIQSTFQAPQTTVRIAAVLTVSLGPGFSCIAAVVVSEVAKQILVPAAPHFPNSTAF